MTRFVRLLERVERREFPSSPFREVWINVADIEVLGTLVASGLTGEVAYVRLRSGTVFHLYDHVSSAWEAIRKASEATP